MASLTEKQKKLLRDGLADMREEVSSLLAVKPSEIEVIANPAVATAEDVANKLNELINTLNE